MPVSGLLDPALILLAEGGNIAKSFSLLNGLPAGYGHKIYILGHYLNPDEKNKLLAAAHKKELTAVYILAGETYDYETACFQTGIGAADYTETQLAWLLPSEKYAAVITEFVPPEWVLPKETEAYKTQFSSQWRLFRKTIRVYNLEFIRRQLKR